MRKISKKAFFLILAAIVILGAAAFFLFRDDPSSPLTRAQRKEYAGIYYDWKENERDARHMTQTGIDQNSTAMRAARHLSEKAVSGYSREGMPEYRPEYGGYDIYRGKLRIYVPRAVPGAREWAEQAVPETLRDAAEFREVENSYGDLMEFMNGEMHRTVLSGNIRIFIAGVEPSLNAVLITVHHDDVAKACELVREQHWEGRVMVEDGGTKGFEYT